MTRVATMTGLKLVSKSIFHKANWSSGDQMAKEASQHEEYYAGTLKTNKQTNKIKYYRLILT